jgi:cell wall-associated NlpC family hydrolase
MKVKFETIKFLLVALIVLLVGCSPIVHFTSQQSKQSRSQNWGLASKNENLDPVRLKVVEEANKWLGTPYCLGGIANCVDCSGLVQNIFRNVGITLPRTASEQAQTGRLIKTQDITVGDLLFFGNGKKISHVAIYVGNNEVVHTSSSRGVVRDRLDTILMSNFLFAKRVIENN